jgi:hypothetical protein
MITLDKALQELKTATTKYDVLRVEAMSHDGPLASLIPHKSNLVQVSEVSRKGITFNIAFAHPGKGPEIMVKPVTQVKSDGPGCNVAELKIIHNITEVTDYDRESGVQQQMLYFLAWLVSQYLQKGPMYMELLGVLDELNNTYWGEVAVSQALVENIRAKANADRAEREKKEREELLDKLPPLQVGQVYGQNKIGKRILDPHGDLVRAIAFNITKAVKVIHMTADKVFFVTTREGSNRWDDAYEFGRQIYSVPKVSVEYRIKHGHLAPASALYDHEAHIKAQGDVFEVGSWWQFASAKQLGYSDFSNLHGEIKKVTKRRVYVQRKSSFGNGFTESHFTHEEWYATIAAGYGKRITVLDFTAPEPPESPLFSKEDAEYLMSVEHPVSDNPMVTNLPNKVGKVIKFTLDGEYQAKVSYACGIDAHGLRQFGIHWGPGYNWFTQLSEIELGLALAINGQSKEAKE